MMGGYSLQILGYKYPSLAFWKYESRNSALSRNSSSGADLHQYLSVTLQQNIPMIANF